MDTPLLNRIVPAVLMALALLAAPALPAGEVPPTPAPDFTLPTLEGTNLRLGEQQGKVVLVNFWASWCGPCRQEMPALDELHQRYNRLGFTVLGVNVEQDPAAARDYLEDLPVSFPVLLDSRNEVTRTYQVSAMPSTVIIDRDGQVRYIHEGYSPGDEALYQDVVRGLIRE